MSETLDPDQQAPAAGSRAPRQDGATLVRAGATVFLLGLVWKALGLVREAAVGALFGANRAMDAFVVAKSIPDMFSTWIETPLRAAVVPIFSRRLHQEGEQRAWDAASNVINTLAVGLALLTLVLFAGSPLLVRLFSSGIRDAAVWDESARLAQIVTASILFSVLAVVLGSISNIYGRQFVPAAGRNGNAIAVLVGVLLLGPYLGVAGYAWGILAGSVVYFLTQLDVLWRHRRHYRWVLRPRAPENLEILRVALPMFIGLTGTRIDVLIDRNFASYLAPGSLSVLSYATLLSAMVTDLVVTIAISVLLPHFAQLIAQGRHDEVRARLVQSVAGYAFLMAPVTILLTTGAKTVVAVVYGRGNFDSTAVAATAAVLVVLALADPLFGAGQMMAQVHIGHGDTKTPMYIGFWRIGFKAVISIALVPTLGILGLAAATALSSAFRTTMLWRRLPDAMRPGRRDLSRYLLPTALPAGVAAAASGVAAWALSDVSAPVRLVSLAGVTAVVFGAVALVTRHWMMSNLLSRLRRRGGGRGPATGPPSAQD